jgi:Gly-Xaa carboxypeptidase
VVPVDNGTINHWTYPPFAGHYDGQYIWGRGSEDDKSNLVAILSALDALLKLDYRPSRTILFSVGFDEEGGASEKYGAKRLAELIFESYGENGIELVVS